MDLAPTTLERRQIWAGPSPTKTALPHTCSPYRLPSGGTLNLGGTHIVTLSFDAVFQPHCPGHTVATPLDPLMTGIDLSVLDNQDPFYSSTNPLIYAISATTIVSYMLVIILFATPRTFYVGGVGGGVSVLGRKGTMGGSYGSNTVIGIGSRPWLQKIAAITLAISMTIVTADAFRYAEDQYDAGYDNSKELTNRIIDGMEIKIVRLISETFLWLAQAQTLIRLFQRHREKMVIKWTAFVLITLEVIFIILNQFGRSGKRHQPRAFKDSIPALNYLFALALNICYAAFVIIYALRKRRFAFFHFQMHSMPLVALLSLTAVLVPVIFFILDLSKPDVSGWGSYVRWVGAGAASIVVWEWVERIEALEREEKKDGILGREVFDGDEMYDSHASKRDRPKPPDDRGAQGRLSSAFGNTLGAKINRMAKVVRWSRNVKAPWAAPLKELNSDSGQSSGLGSSNINANRGMNPAADLHPGPPATVGSPVSRADSSSAASTVYAVRYHPTIEPTPPIPEERQAEDVGNHPDTNTQKLQSSGPENETEARVLPKPSRLSRIPLPFRRQRQTPPAEVAAALAKQQIEPSSPAPVPTPTILERLHLRRHQHPAPMPKGVIFVPAPPRRRPTVHESTHEQSNAVDHEDDDRESEGGDNRPPAVVRNALRRSNPAPPVLDNEQYTNFEEAHMQAQSQHAGPISPQNEAPQVEIPPSSQHSTTAPSQPTNHDR